MQSDSVLKNVSGVLERQGFISAYLHTALKKQFACQICAMFYNIRLCGLRKDRRNRYIFVINKESAIIAGF